MTRLVLIAAGVFVLSHTPPAERAIDAVRDFRERQYVTGQRAGCQMQLAVAVIDQDPVRARVLIDRCAELERGVRN